MNLFIKLLGTGSACWPDLPAPRSLTSSGKSHRQEAAQGRRGRRSHHPALALTFALISAAVSAIIQVLANRGTQRAITRFAKSQDIV